MSGGILGNPVLQSLFGVFHCILVLFLFIYFLVMCSEEDLWRMSTWWGSIYRKVTWSVLRCRRCMMTVHCHCIQEAWSMGR